MFQHSPRLRKRDAGEQLGELADWHTVFEVFEQRSYGHTRAAKHPGATHTLGIAFDCAATRPIDHAANRSTGTLDARAFVGPRAGAKPRIDAWLRRASASMQDAGEHGVAKAVGAVRAWGPQIGAVTEQCRRARADARGRDRC